MLEKGHFAEGKGSTQTKDLESEITEAPDREEEIAEAETK